MDSFQKRTTYLINAPCTLHHFSSSLIKHRLHICLIVSHPRRGAIQKFKILTDQFSFLAFCILSSDFVVNAGMIWVTFEFDIFLYLHFVIDLALHTPGNIRNCKMLFDWLVIPNALIMHYVLCYSYRLSNIVPCIFFISSPTILLLC